MFPKNRRIPRKLFPLFADEVKVFKNNIFLLKIVFIKKNGLPLLQTETLLDSRFGFSVSKKIAKKAVTRNKLRRTGYRLLKEYLPQIKPNILAIFYFKIVPKNNEEIADSLELILKKSKIIK